MDEKSDGLVSVVAAGAVEETVARFEAILREKKIKLFAVVDHSGEAEQAGLQMRPTKLLIFGNPVAGTPVMQAAPTAAIDLPLKVLVWEDATGKCQITYNSPGYLAARHGIPQELTGRIGVVAGLVESLVSG